MKKTLVELMSAVEMAQKTLNELINARKPGQHGARRQIRRAEEALVEAKAAYNKAYLAEKAAKAEAWQAVKAEQKESKEQLRSEKKDRETQDMFLRALWLRHVEQPTGAPVKARRSCRNTAEAMNVRSDLFKRAKALRKQIHETEPVADALDEAYAKFGFSCIRSTKSEKLADLKARLNRIEAEINRLYPIRKAKTIAKREDSVGFSLPSFDFDKVMSFIQPFVAAAVELKTRLYVDGQVNPDVRQEGQTIVDDMKDAVADMAGKPIVLHEANQKVSRMSRSLGSDIFGIDYDAKSPTKEWITVEHGIQFLLDQIPAAFWGRTKAEGEIARDEFAKSLYCKLGFDGVLYVRKDGTCELYKGFAASASHQKDEKLIMARAESLKKHERAIWFTLTIQDMLDLTVNGAGIWKMRANLLRPIRCKVTTKDGRWLSFADIDWREDIEIERIIQHARTVGELDENGEIFHDGPAKVSVKKADGTILATVELAQWGQCTGYGVKGCLADGTSAIETAARMEGKPVPANLKPLIAGIGCWKFDKVGMTVEQFTSELAKLAKTYKGLDKLYLLREGDELEGQEKIRRLTRSLIQQWIHMASGGIRRMTRRTRQGLKRMKTLKGAIASLSESGKLDSEKSMLGKLFTAAPWLVLNPNVQQYLKSKYERRQAEAAACKLRTEGCYPYIQEDLVAIAQVWVFGADPARTDLGVLKAGEISVPGIRDGEEVLAVRFPANYQTADVRINRACMDAFSSCSGICQISYYDDILIRQDGDVDGDEICIITDRLAIDMTKRMYAEFNPPVVVFAHGGKAPKQVIGSKENLIATMYQDLWKAKKFDGVGRYANLAMLCCHLASIAYAQGDMAEVNIRLNQMSLASTGAILSIDQVKGNDVSLDLIKRLEWIDRNVRDAMGRLMPFTQQFNKKDCTSDKCAPVSEALCDQIADLILLDTGVYSMDFGALAWNKTEAKRSMLSFGQRTTSFRDGVLPKDSTTKLGNNWFNKLCPEDMETKALIDAGKPVSHTGILKMLWRNANALEFRMKGENLTVKRAEYLAVVREILYSLATTNTWVAKDGHVFTDAEKKASVCNVAVSEALGMSGSGLSIVDADKRGNYAIFVMKVFAKEILWSLKRNPADTSKFMIENAMTDLDFDTEINAQYDEVCEVITAEENAPDDGREFDEEPPTEGEFVTDNDFYGEEPEYDDYIPDVDF